MKKFELARETEKEFFGIKMFRVRALISFSGVSKGDLGGYVQKGKNLSHYGNAWVSGDARVCGDAHKSPLNIIGTKYNITISDDQVVWGCRKMTFDEIKSFQYSDCKEKWDENEFKLNKKIITEMIRYHRPEKRM